MRARVLVVDDEKSVTSVFERLLVREGYVVDVASNGRSALAAISDHPPDLILLDVLIPGLDGFEVCRGLKRESATRLTPVVLITGLSDRDSRIKGAEAGADDFLTKPVDPQELLARVRSLVRLKRYTDDLDSAASIITALAVMIEARDGYTEGHCYRMANYATSLGRRIGLGHDDLQALHRGGFLHDIGMLTIPDTVLRKPGPLEPEEFELIKAHTVVGESLCGNLRSLQAVRPIVRHHHERLDGSGYPDGLRGDAVPLLAQIIGLVDVYDAVTTQRPYHGAQPIERAIELLRQQASIGWQRPDLVEEFVGIVQSGQLDTFNGRNSARRTAGRSERRASDARGNG
jgi:putative two-component system response regulator